MSGPNIGRLRKHPYAIATLLLFCNQFLYSEASLPAFAVPGGGGFGGAGGGGFSKKSKKKQKKGNLLSEISASPPPSTTIVTPDTGNAAQLDKWGLPIPTEDDLFPPMPPGTELIPINKDDEEPSLSDIRVAMKNHIELNGLEDRFDDQGLEMNPLPGRDPMKLRLIHRSPPVLTVENFLTEEECEQVKSVVLPPKQSSTKNDINNQKAPVQVHSATFSALAQSKRTSTSWFCYYSQVPTLLAKAHHILGVPTLEQMEEPQTVRYKTGQEFSWHYDEVPSNQLQNGGQRLATLLVYLNDVSHGGGTVFRDLKDGTTNEVLTMKPKLGSALLFFPAFKDGKPDDRSLHKGEVAGDEKWIIQMWIHERVYRATLPEGNFQQFAKDDVDRVGRELGYM